MRKLLKSNEAYTKLVGGVISLLITIGIGAVVYWEISDGFTGSSAEANASIAGVESMATTVFDLLPLIALVVVGSLLILIVMRGMGGSGRDGL